MDKLKELNKKRIELAEANEKRRIEAQIKEVQQLKSQKEALKERIEVTKLKTELAEADSNLSKVKKSNQPFFPEFKF